MGYTLYAVQDFASLAPQIVLEEIGAPYKAVFLDVEAGDLAAPDHLARQPMGLVPAFDTGQGQMFETGAILLWLADRHGLAPAPSVPDRSAFLSWFVFVNNGLHPLVMDLVHPEYIAGDAHADAISERVRDRLHQRLGILDQMAAQRPWWMTPDAPGVIGPYIGMLLRWGQVFAHIPDHAIRLADYPALRALAAGVEMRPAAQRAGAANGLSGRFFTEPKG
jgi:glutathione S-transferase